MVRVLWTLATLACVATAATAWQTRSVAALLLQPGSRAAALRRRQLRTQSRSHAPQMGSVGGQGGPQPDTQPFAIYEGKCVGQGSIFDGVYGVAEAAQIVAADPTTYPAYLLNRHSPSEPAGAYICSANYGQEVFDAGPEWTLCVYQGQPTNAQGPGGGVQPPGALDEAMPVPDFEQYCHFMHDRGERLTEAELRQRYDKYCLFMKGNADVLKFGGFQGKFGGVRIDRGGGGEA